jgi:hypothetical protein
MWALGMGANCQGDHDLLGNQKTFLFGRGQPVMTQAPMKKSMGKKQNIRVEKRTRSEVDMGGEEV